jgi:hypothetical protein
MPDHAAFEGLIIEIDAADVVRNLDLAKSVARQLRFNNIAISIDNLGSEWPSLVALHDFPFVEIKIDRQFITGCADDRLRQTVCRQILDLADSFDARTVAQGVAIRESLGAGGRSYRPLFARDGLSATFVEPALRFIGANGGAVIFGQRLRALAFDAERVTALDFGDASVPLCPDDAVVLAVPPVVAASLVPGLSTPTEFRAIVNAHFRVDPAARLAPITGVVNGMVEWLFAFPDRLSVTISNADRLLDTPREELASQIWREVGEIAGIAGPLPPWQIVRERRATFAALPRAKAKRPSTRTLWNNLLLAGDWTATGLPATIEGAIRSGNRAADLIGKTT